MATRVLLIGGVPGCSVTATLSYTSSGEVNPDGSEDLTNAGLDSVTVTVVGCVARVIVWLVARKRPAWERVCTPGSHTFNAKPKDTVGDYAWAVAIECGGVG
jgi:hypothetical protein